MKSPKYHPREAMTNSPRGKWYHPREGMINSPREKWNIKNIALDSICRSSLLDWKKDRNWTELNCKRPDHQLQLHKFWIFSVASCKVCQKIKKKNGKNRSRPVATGLSSCRVLYLTHTHFSLIVGPWIIKNDQELVEIWPKTCLYATQMYVPSIFAQSLRVQLQSLNIWNGLDRLWFPVASFWGKKTGLNWTWKH